MARHFPTLQAVQKLPFKDTTLSIHVATYDVAAPRKEIQRALFRFYRDRLFYIWIVFDNDSLHLREMPTAASRVAAALGPAQTVMPADNAPGGMVERMRWQRDGVEAQLSFFPAKAPTLPRIELHLVDSAIDNETKQIN